jgi:16S rRNA (cytidine1402-2'-O)-methyltransferase
VQTLNTNTLLGVAVDVTGVNEIIKTQTIAEWRRNPVEWPKLPAVFLFLAG